MPSSVPVISPTSGVNNVINSRYNRIYNNPHFDYLSEMLPRDIKDMFKWCELVYNGMPVIAQGIRKLINYPITDFSYNTESEVLRKDTKKLLKTIKMKSALLSFGNDWYVYGNAMRSVYFPFVRFLKCAQCGNEVNISEAKFKVANKGFDLHCPKCMTRRRATIVDRESFDISKIVIVCWDPKSIELKHNPITGECSYYYNIPPAIKNGIMTGDVNILKSVPEVFINAVFNKKVVQFKENFMHCKAPTLSGFSTGWGISPILATLKNYSYIAILRKASEAIGLEHITPQRILFPQATSNDPSLIGGMERWRTEVSKAIERWRIDPNYVMTAPFPTGVANIGSQGRALTPTEEIKDARNEMALALDIPPSLILGDTNIQNSAVALRIMENQLEPYIEQLTEFANWVIELINAKYSKSYCEIDLVPFRLADDIMNKQLLLQGQGQTVSKKTVQESLNLDPDKERERLIDDALQAAKDQKEIEEKMREEEQNAAASSKAEEMSATDGDIPQYNQQKLIAKANEMAQQFLAIPYEQRKSYLSQLQNEDYVMWALVGKQLEQMRNAADNKEPVTK